MYTLIDGRRMHALYPETFEIPSMKDVLKVKPGDFVKLGFIEPEAHGGMTERMWVEVMEDRKGKLSNVPIHVNAKFGDLVEYLDRNILSIMPKKSAQFAA